MENENDLMRTVIEINSGKIADGSSNVIREIEKDEYKYAAGPLNLNRSMRRACTIMGRELAISAKEFNALDMLVTREGEYIAFDELYTTVWGETESLESKEDARASIDNLLMQVCNDGEGFMWIEYSPDAGYRFKTYWGKNLDEDVRTDIPLLTFMPQADTTTPVNPKKPSQTRKPQLVALLAGVSAIAAAIILMLLFLFNSPLFNPPEVEAPVYMEMEDPNIPLASAPDVDTTDAED